MNIVARKIGGWLSRYLSKENKSAGIGIPTDIESVRRCAQVGDVILVEGNTKFSTAIKYLTQSTWSHTTLYVGTITVNGKVFHDQIIEADVSHGIIHSPLDDLKGYHTRICRPIGLNEAEIRTMVDHAVSRIGGTYDLRNVLDLVRYLVPILPFPAQHRRKLLTFGSGEPTKAICSTLVAEVFEHVHYPILPKLTRTNQLKRRHHSLMTPRDFDVSPYFKVIKPTVELGFDFRSFDWNREGRSSLQ